MFCAGPTSKYSEWKDNFNPKDLGRSHRSEIWVKKIQLIYEKIISSLNIPHNYKVAFVNGSSTAAMDSLFWNMLGNRPSNVLSHDVFSNRWADEILKTLRIPGSKCIIEELNNININYDFIFNMVGTTNGIKWNNKSILEKINGLVVCDATSAVFCEEIEWKLLDCIGFSFQKSLGAEAGIGCIVLSPKAFKQLENINNINLFPIPRFLKINKDIFKGKLNNTPSLISLEDINLNLDIFIKRGGLDQAIKQCKKNKEDIVKCISNSILEERSLVNSNSIICLTLKSWHTNNNDDKWGLIHEVSKQCESYGIYDISGHPDDDPCWRFWIGPTIQNCKSHIDTFIHIVNYCIHNKNK